MLEFPGVQLHPWNRAFEWRDVDRPLRRVTPEQARDFDERGFFVLEEAFDATAVAEVVAEIDPWEEKVTAFLRTREGGRLFIADADAITFSTHLVAKSERLRAFCAGPVFCDLAWDLLGPDVRLYWDQAVYKKPNSEKSFPWHQDNGYTYLEPQQYLTCWVALTDADETNGCPWLVPGLHRRGTLAHELTDTGWRCLKEGEAEGAVPVAVPAGGIAVFSSLTPHATGPNTTDRTRKTYIVQLAPEGAHCLRGDPSGAPVARETQNDADRQFPILRAGKPA